jgi:hypothetical protein
MKNYPFNVALEIKATSTNTIPKSALKDHQRKALLAVRTDEGLSYKIPDVGHVRLPFDAFQLKKTHSFVVACSTKKGLCLVVHPDKWDGVKFTPQTDSEFVIHV